MVAAAQNTNNTTIRSILLAKKVTGSNFTNWYRNLKIVLSMSPDLQRTLEKYNAYDMMKELKTMFKEQDKQELFEIVKAFHVCKQEDGQSLSSYLLKMKSYLDTLEHLGYAMPKELGVTFILNSLNKDYDQFVQNYNMHNIGKTLAELHAMLKLHEKGIPKKAETLVVLAIWEDDFSRYGFVYLMKHKHEVFETFKVLQNEVKINSVSERRNQNLLDMVRSMMNLTTLPKSFWGYALETIARILNMVLTKKVDRTPYEIWHGKSPKLSYLRVWGWDLDEPPNYKATLADPESDKWLDAMNTKMQSMKDNKVWYLVDLPSNCQTVGCKWLFKNKTNMDGNVHTFKALLVAKGYIQTYGVDYKETFSPVADIRAIRILLAIATFYAMRFDKWMFDEEIKKIGFTQNPDEPCVYLKASGSNVAFLVLYDDDILLMENNVTMLQEVKSWLYKCFSMKDLGEAVYILRIKIIRDRSKRLIALSQSAYLEKILKKFRMKNSKKGYNPMMEKPDYRKSQGAKTYTEVHHMQRAPYALAIGSIMYAVRCTRPDVAFAQNLCSRFQQNPDELKVSCYVDASFQTDKDDMKSQTGYVFILNGGVVDWKSVKQSTTDMSSTKAKYIAAVEASMEAVWIRKFIDVLGGVMPSNKRSMEMLCDNELALAIASDPGILKGSRHFQRKYHYIREVIQEAEIVIKKVYTDDNVADPFTKLMPLSKYFEHAMAIGIVPASSLM
nr:hypothetical protein [Tanacetum cinerariifolium]